MDCTSPIPRVNGELLPKFKGQTVKLVCKVLDNSSPCRMAASDGVPVMVHAPAPFSNQVHEVEGVVMDNLEIQESSRASFGDNFDMELYNEVVKMANSTLSHLF